MIIHCLYSLLISRTKEHGTYCSKRKVRFSYERLIFVDVNGILIGLSYSLKIPD